MKFMGSFWTTRRGRWVVLSGLVLIATGCKPKTPDVMGLARVEAETAITGAGLQVGQISLRCHDAVPAGSVVTQQPAGGIRVRKGTAVDLEISSGPCPVITAVPNLSGMIRSEAESAITAAGLVVGSVSTACSNTAAPDTVASQNPGTGISVTTGSIVNFTLSSGPCPVITAVPNLSGMSRGEAESVITAAGLVVGSVSTACSDTAAPDTVASQNPGAGISVTTGSIVNFTLSSGPCPVIVTVPNLSGMSRGEAESAITAAGLTVGTANAACSNTDPLDTVIHQSPTAATQVTLGSAVDFDFAAGSCVSVPDLSNVDMGTAIFTLQGLNLGASISTRCDNNTTVDAVITQDPIAGSNVLEGSVVHLVVCAGPCPVVVPNLVDLSEQTARDLLASVGLTVGTITTACSNVHAADSVANQSPIGGSVVMPGAVVDLEISTGPCPVPVPHLVGMTRNDAESALQSVGLVPVMSYTCSPIFPPDIVATQTPASGTSMLPGSTVFFTLATGGCDDPVTITDTTLSSFIRGLFNITDPATPVTRQNMLNISSLDIPNMGITSLQGLEAARNLQALYLAGNQVVDVSPLSGLNKLRHLDIRDNQVADLGPLATGVTFIDADATLFPRVLECTGNPLNSDSCSIHIPALIAREVEVQRDCP